MEKLNPWEIIIMSWILWTIAGIYILYKIFPSKENKGKLDKDVSDRLSRDDRSNSSSLYDIHSRASKSKPPKNKHRNKAEWHMPGTTQAIGPLALTKGFYYYGEHLPSSRGYYGSEASLINPKLNAHWKSPDTEGKNLSYWPEYSEISPFSRAAYLNWLASERDDPDTYIGYVFLYFYGLERRLLVDKVSDSERSLLIEELYRLLSVYGKNNSFKRYCSDLIDFVLLTQSKDDTFPPTKYLQGRSITNVFKYSLAKTVDAGKPINIELALAWVKGSRERKLKIAARRCEKEFDSLFTQAYQEKYGKGIIVKPNKTKLQISYHPASPSIGYVDAITLNLPNPSILKGPFNKLYSIAEECTEKLAGYSRFISKPEHNRDSLTAISKLPAEAQHAVKSRKFNLFKAFLDDQFNRNRHEVPIEGILKVWGDDKPDKFNKSESEQLASLVEMAGYGMAPDIRYHHAKPEMEGSISLFKGGHGQDFQPSHSYNQLGTILRLGAMVATVDNHIHDNEVHMLESLVEKNKLLKPIEVGSLKAYLHWRLQSSKSVAGLKAKLDQLSAREKEGISKILLNVARADSKIENSEIKELEKLYKKLGLDKELVVRELHHSASTSANQPERATKETEVTKPGTGQRGTVINEELLKIHESETSSVKKILENIFVEDDEDEVESAPEPAESSSTNILNLLSEKHQELYKQLIQKEEWPQKELVELCSKLDLMPDGALEVLNDWAYDNLDAPLIDEGDPVYIDLELVEEIQSL